MVECLKVIRARLVSSVVFLDAAVFLGTGEPRYSGRSVSFVVVVTVSP